MKYLIYYIYAAINIIILATVLYFHSIPFVFTHHPLMILILACIDCLYLLLISRGGRTRKLTVAYSLWLWFGPFAFYRYYAHKKPIFVDIILTLMTFSYLIYKPIGIYLLLIAVAVWLVDGFRLYKWV